MPLWPELHWHEWMDLAWLILVAVILVAVVLGNTCFTITVTHEVREVRAAITEEQRARAARRASAEEVEP